MSQQPELGLRPSRFRHVVRPLGACQSDPMAPKAVSSPTTAAALKSVGANAAGNVNGAAGQRPAYYEVRCSRST